MLTATRPLAAGGEGGEREKRERGEGAFVAD